MNILEIYEPLFQYICRLNRLGRSGISADMSTVRSEINDILARMRSKAAGDRLMDSVMRRTELPAVFFIDSIISQSKLRFASDWNFNRLAAERNELGGDERFWEYVDDALNETTEEASASLPFFFTCIGLGFTGDLKGEVDDLQRYANKLYQRIHPDVRSDPQSLICPESYDLIDRRDLRPPEDSRTPMIIGALGLFVLIALVIYYGMYMSASDVFRESLRGILEQAPQHAN